MQRMQKPPVMRLKFDGCLLSLPLIGRVILGANTARFARTLSILASSAVPILDGMKIAGQVLTNKYIQKCVKDASDAVREGSSLKNSLQQSKTFPPMMIHMIASGETGGKLVEMLSRTANYQEREVGGLIATLLGILQTLPIVSMCAVVITIVLAFLLPIFALNHLIR